VKYKYTPEGTDMPVDSGSEELLARPLGKKLYI
jgi:hypothetical protein